LRVVAQENSKLNESYGQQIRKETYENAPLASNFCHRTHMRRPGYDRLTGSRTRLRSLTEPGLDADSCTPAKTSLLFPDPSMTGMRSPRGSKALRSPAAHRDAVSQIDCGEDARIKIYAPLQWRVPLAFASSELRKKDLGRPTSGGSGSIGLCR